MSDWVGIGTRATGGTEGLTLREMISMLGIYLNDIKIKTFKPTLLVSMLNNGQNKAIRALKRHILNKLDKEVLSQSLDSNGAFDLSGLSTKIYRNDEGIDKVYLTGGKSCNKISFDEYEEFVNEEKTFTKDEPVYFVRGSKIYIKPSGYNIDLYYMREPVAMELSITSDDDINCEFDIEIQKIIMGFAVEDYVDEYPKCARLYSNALITIEELNKKQLSDSSKFARYYA